MTWQEKLEKEKKKEMVYTVHVSLPKKQDVYYWLKDQSRQHGMPVARIAALILEDAMLKDQAANSASLTKS